jgi:hypothetical protein
MSASSSINEERPPALAADGDPDTWWIAGGRDAGQGPTKERPEWLQLTYPEAGVYDRLVLCPRPHYGPRECELTCSPDGQSFRPLVRFAATQAPMQVIAFPRVSARAFRLRILSSYDPSHPEAPRNVHVGEMALLAPGEAAPVWNAGASQPVLLEAGKGLDEAGMRVRFRVDHGPAIQQFVTVLSLPDEATIYATAFRVAAPDPPSPGGLGGSGAEATVRVTLGPAFPLEVSAPPGFEKPVTQYRGRRWLNMSDHLGFVSVEDLPASLPANRFALSEKRAYQVRAGEWFAPLALVIYARQPHTLTERCAEGVRLLRFDGGKMKLEVVSSSGKRTFDLDLAGK